MGNSKKKIKFICLPGGGTSPVAFFKWFGLLSPKYRPLFVDIPGRGMRKNEAPYTDIDSITNDLYAGWQKIMSDGREEEYVLFCYCMGSVFMHELVKKIAENHQKMPLHVFIASADVPDGEMYKRIFLEMPETKKQFYDLIQGCFPEYLFPDKEMTMRFRHDFVDILYQKYALDSNTIQITKEDFKNMKSEVSVPLESRDFQECLYLANQLIACIVADCRICSQYQNADVSVQKLPCDISCITGSQDILYTESVMQKWKDYTLGKCFVYVISGGHSIYLDVNADGVGIFNNIAEQYEEILCG